MVGDTPVSEQDSQEMAEDRTNLAEDRTLMAVERTMASWMGTSMGAIGVGLGFRAIFGEIEPGGASRIAANTELGEDRGDEALDAAAMEFGTD